MSLPPSRAKVTSEPYRKILEESVTTVLILYGLPWEMAVMTRGRAQNDPPEAVIVNVFST